MVISYKLIPLIATRKACRNRNRNKQHRQKEERKRKNNIYLLITSLKNNMTKNSCYLI